MHVPLLGPLGDADCMVCGVALLVPSKELSLSLLLSLSLPLTVSLFLGETCPSGLSAASRCRIRGIYPGDAAFD